MPSILLGALAACESIGESPGSNQTMPNQNTGDASAGSVFGGSSRGNGTSTSVFDAGGSGSPDATTATNGASAMRGPTPAGGGANFPFPQNRQVDRCTYPTNYSNADVQNAYAKWKADLVTSDSAAGYLRVQRTASDGNPAGCTPPGSTVSEGIGYGMLIAVYMNDESLFDNLWLYEQQHLNMSNGMTDGLMTWAPGPGTTGNGCTGAATDADEDMAFALIMADKQWGGQGTLKQSYKQTAIDQLNSIWPNEIDGAIYVRPGDHYGGATFLNPSYLAPAYYRAFAQYDPMTCPQGTNVATWASEYNMSCHLWWGVLDQAYSTISDALNPSNKNASNGLVPAWCNDSTPGQCTPTGMTGQPFTYQYDSCRTPFRIGLDWCFNGEMRAQAYVAKTSAFFNGLGAANIVDGYALDGTPQPTSVLAHGGVPLAAPFVGPAAVGAMSAARYQSFLDVAYGLVATDNLMAGGEYYSSSWTVMSLLMMTGNFLDYTQLSPLVRSK